MFVDIFVCGILTRAYVLNRTAERYVLHFLGDDDDDRVEVVSSSLIVSRYTDDGLNYDVLFSKLRLSVCHLELRDQLSVIRNFIYILQLSPDDSRFALDSASFPHESQDNYTFEY